MVRHIQSQDRTSPRRQLGSHPSTQRVSGLTFLASIIAVDVLFSVFSFVRCVQFSADGKYLATACDQTVQVYDTRTGSKTRFGSRGAF